MHDAATERYCLAVPNEWASPSFEVDGAIAIPRPAFVRTVTFYDTVDLALARSKAFLARSDDGWLLHVEPLVTKARLVRIHSPHRAKSSVDLVPDEIQRAVTARTLGADLRPVAAADELVRPIDIVTLDGHLLATVLDTTTTVARGDGGATPLRHVTVTTTADTPPDLPRELLHAIEAHEGTRSSPAAMVVQLLGRRATLPGLVPIVPLDEHSDARAAIRAALSGHVRRLIAHDARLRTVTDQVAVHQSRVATRRLRADLKTFRSLLDRDWAEELTDRIHPLADALGAVRDLDVLIERLESSRDALPKSDHDGANGVIDLARYERDLAATALRAALDEPDHVTLLAELASAATTPFTTADATRPAADVLPHLARKRWKQLRTAVHSLDDDATDEALHAVRIDAKQCRYAAQAAARVIGPDAKRFAHAIAAVQQVLGDHHDAVTTEAWIRAHAAHLSGADQFAAGALATIQAQLARASREAFPAVWAEASGSELRTWWK